MTFDLTKSIEILSRTPDVLEALLNGLSAEWLNGNEGVDTWSPFEVVGHLILCEETNFLPRTLFILSDGENKVVEPLDMAGHTERIAGKSISDALRDFRVRRQMNLEVLRNLNLTNEQLQRTAMHSRIGEITVSQVLSTWVAHDLTHLGQITRVLAKQYKDETGPFIAFLHRLR